MATGVRVFHSTRGGLVPIFDPPRLSAGSIDSPPNTRMDAIADRLGALLELQRHQSAEAFAAAPCDYDEWGELYAGTGRRPLNRAEMLNALRLILAAGDDAEPPAPLTVAEVASVLAASDF